jgi:hypothetical protein
MSNGPQGPFLVPTENIVLAPLKSLTPGSSFVTEQNCVSFSINFTPTGGSFTIRLLQGSLNPQLTENLEFSLPFGRIGCIKSIGQEYTSGGMVDVYSGPCLPLTATLETFYTFLPNQTNQLSNICQFVADYANVGPGGVIGGFKYYPVYFSSLFNPTLLNFSYRGPMLQGIQQAASILLLDVFFRKEGIFVVNPGALANGGFVLGFSNPSAVPVGATVFTVPQGDIVSVTQVVDYSLDIASRLNPTLAVQIDGGLPGQYVYDGDHCQKQPKFTVQCGAPKGTDAQDHIDIPDGWSVDGTFEEWQPAGNGSLGNPNPSVPKYWKTYPSPTNQGFQRGIMSFTRLLKEIKIPGNTSTWVASPITGLTKQGSTTEFDFDEASTENGMYGFTADNYTINDIITDQQITFQNAVSLIPQGGGDSGTADANFYSITMEMWTFPLVNPVAYPLGPNINPFAIPPGVRIVTPSQNVKNAWGSGYYGQYLTNYQKVNSPRLRTTVTSVYRNALPQCGDHLLFDGGVRYQDAGRIETVQVNFGRSGVTLVITAEAYQFASGLWNSFLSGHGTGATFN